MRIALKRPSPVLVVLIAITSISFSPQDHSAKPIFTLVYPATTNVVLQDNTLTVLLNVEPSVSKIVAYVTWDTTMILDLATKNGRGDLLKKIAASVPQNLLLRQSILQASTYHQTAESMPDYFEFRQRTKAVDLFVHDTLRLSTKALRKFEGSSSTLQVSGWVPVAIEESSPSPRCAGVSVAVSMHVLPGMNQIPIEFYSSTGAMIASDTIRAFYHVDLGHNVTPEVFVQQIFHKKEHESACARCHTSNPPEKTSIGTVESLPLKCESCHQMMSQQRSVHGLLASNDCSVCHESSAGSGYKPTYSLDKENETCLQCHDNTGSDIRDKAVVHVPVAGGRCSNCHSPHASPNLYQLRKSVNETCYSCHNDKREGSHPVVLHPVSGQRDPRSPDKELRCTSCHNPHASNNKALLTVPGGYFALCQSCHNK